MIKRVVGELEGVAVGSIWFGVSPDEQLVSSRAISMLKPIRSWVFIWCLAQGSLTCARRAN